MMWTYKMKNYLLTLLVLLALLLTAEVPPARSAEFQGFNLNGKDVPTWQELTDMRDRTLAKHPRTRFIACDLGVQSHALASLAAALNKYPNLFEDISARDYEIGRTPRAAARFLDENVSDLRRNFASPNGTWTKPRYPISPVYVSRCSPAPVKRSSPPESSPCGGPVDGTARALP